MLNKMPLEGLETESMQHFITVSANEESGKM